MKKAKALAPFITNGSLTPNDPRDLVGEILGKELEPLRYEGADEKPLQLIVGANKGVIPPSNPVNPELPVNPIMKSFDGDVVAVLKDLRDTLEDVRDKWNR